ncbi:1,4-beta-xylanase [Bifidobacterium callitrichos]|uniref:1,4-beta-xylanase n=1 Tax=Bifidobacterium callitrichos TaxID=762209 RepID=A0A5M9ZBZ3_9BIFI|nr:1,4-beta-xylanase [Bifidobacterium callitrichos]
MRDYRTPVELTLVVADRAFDGDTEFVRIPVIVRVVVLDTPVRISGERGAEQRGVGATSPTGEVGWRYFADPQIVAYDGRYYIFPTTDGYADWGGWQIHCFVSDDLTSWRDLGVVVDLKDQHLDGSGRTDILPDRTTCAWAPGFAIRDGRFYLYFSGHGRGSRTNQTNVAVSERIDGGYELQPMAGFDEDGVVAGDIDPAVFEDPRTGRWWITWGQSPGMYAELNDDMMSIKPGTLVETQATRGIREGSYLHARRYKGVWTYYYTYSIDDTSSEWYRIAYATAPSMEGDGSQWTYRGEMLVQDASKGIRGTGHHSIMQVPGTDDWYIAYHCFLDDAMRPRGIDRYSGRQLVNGNKREVRIAKFTYTHPDDAAVAAGEVPLINAVPVTYEGPKPQRYTA